MKINLKKAVAKEFTELVARQMPWLRLGRIAFVGRDDYGDYSYAGNGQFPVGVPHCLESVNYGDKQNRAERLEELHEKFNGTVANYLARVTFHELGHAISLALRGMPERAARPNYGFEPVDTFFDDPKKSKLKMGLQAEIKAFAVQHRLHQFFGFDDQLETTLPAMLRLIASRDQWRGVMNTADKKDCYNRMYSRATKARINEALDHINVVLGVLESRAADYWIRADTVPKTGINMVALPGSVHRAIT